MHMRNAKKKKLPVVQDIIYIATIPGILMPTWLNKHTVSDKNESEMPLEFVLLMWSLMILVVHKYTTDVLVYLKDEVCIVAKDG
jgi:hypothetical protein